MKSRDYLVSLGLSKPKARGRLSFAAKEALQKALDDGMQFSDLVSNVQTITKVPTKQTAIVPVVAIKTRENKVVYGIDRGQTSAQKDLIVAFDSCAGCGKAISYCKHELPILPKWINSNAYMERPW